MYKRQILILTPVQLQQNIPIPLAILCVSVGCFIGSYPDIVVCMRAVSYTHLDVYKRQGLDTYSADWTYAVGQFSHDTVYLDTFARGSYDTPIRTLIGVTARQLSVWGGSTQLLEEDLRNMLHNKWSCVVLAGNERSARTVAADLQAAGLPADYLENPQTIQRGTVVVTAGALSAGIECPCAFFVLITHGRLLTTKPGSYTHLRLILIEYALLTEKKPPDGSSIVFFLRTVTGSS